MIPADLSVRVNRGQPNDHDAWNALAKANGNLLQTSYIDSVERLFRHCPAYLEVWRDGELVGGVKLYEWEPRRLRPFTGRMFRTLLQHGESIVLQSIPDAVRRDVVTRLREASLSHARERGAISLRIAGHYGRPDLMIDLSPMPWRPRSESTFNVAYLTLANSEQQLWDAMHKSHRRWIRRSRRAGITVNAIRDIGVLTDLMRSTFRTRPDLMPRPDYVERMFRILEPLGLAKLYAAADDSRVYAAALVTQAGDVADYAFGGTIPSQTGAGHALQWEIVMALRNRGVHEYVLGQVATAADRGNPKFSEGVSPFKRRFGTAERPSYSRGYTVRPLRYTALDWFSRWTQRT